MRQTSEYPSNAVAIVPSDTTELGLVGFYVGGTGNVVVMTPAGNTVTFTGCPVGFKIDLAVRHVMAATTATALVGLLP